MRSSASGWRPRSQERHTSPDDSTATTATGTTNDASITLTYTRYPSTDVPATLPRVLAASTRGVCSPMRLRKRTDAIATTTYATITAPRTTSLRSPNTTPVPSTANVSGAEDHHADHERQGRVRGAERRMHPSAPAG